MTDLRYRLGVPFGIGAATALLLGIYAGAHDPTHRDFVVTGFDGATSWKAAFTTSAFVLFVLQVGLGRWITGPSPAWAPDFHRLVGTVAFAVTIPVAFHCIWSIGYQGQDWRTTTHSLSGLVAYGLYVAKVISARSPADRPVWALPVTGSLLGTAMLVVWWTSSLHWYSGGGGL